MNLFLYLFLNKSFPWMWDFIDVQSYGRLMQCSKRFNNNKNIQKILLKRKDFFEHAKNRFSFPWIRMVIEKKKMKIGIISSELLNVEFLFKLFISGQNANNFFNNERLRLEFKNFLQFDEQENITNLPNHLFLIKLLSRWPLPLTLIQQSIISDEQILGVILTTCSGSDCNEIRISHDNSILLQKMLENQRVSEIFLERNKNWIWNMAIQDGTLLMLMIKKSSNRKFIFNFPLEDISEPAFCLFWKSQIFNANDLITWACLRDNFTCFKKLVSLNDQNLDSLILESIPNNFIPSFFNLRSFRSDSRRMLRILNENRGNLEKINLIFVKSWFSLIVDDRDLESFESEVWKCASSMPTLIQRQLYTILPKHTNTEHEIHAQKFYVSVMINFPNLVRLEGSFMNRVVNAAWSKLMFEGDLKQIIFSMKDDEIRSTTNWNKIFALLVKQAPEKVIEYVCDLLIWRKGKEFWNLALIVQEKQVVFNLRLVFLLVESQIPFDERSNLSKITKIKKLNKEIQMQALAVYETCHTRPKITKGMKEMIEKASSNEEFTKVKMEITKRRNITYFKNAESFKNEEIIDSQPISQSVYSSCSSQSQEKSRSQSPRNLKLELKEDANSTNRKRKLTPELSNVKKMKIEN